MVRNGVDVGWGRDAGRGKGGKEIGMDPVGRGRGSWAMGLGP